MEGIGEARRYISQEAYAKAARLLDRMLGQDKENSELWYLRGLVSLKTRHYPAAIEAFERAAWIRPKAEYWKMQGVAHMESCELEDAIGCFQRVLRHDKQDVQAYIFTAICHMFLNDPAARGYVQRAYLVDRVKTRQLLQEFYGIFFKSNPTIPKNVRAALERKLENIQI